MRSGSQRDRTDVFKERALVATRQPIDGIDQRQPVHRPHIAHQFMNRIAARFHAPVVHDLGAAAELIDQRAEKLVHEDIVPGFFHHLALGRGARRLAVVELALRQYPFIALAQAHHGDQRRLRRPQHNASRRQHRRPRHLCSRFPISNLATI